MVYSEAVDHAENHAKERMLVVNFSNFVTDNGIINDSQNGGEDQRQEFLQKTISIEG